MARLVALVSGDAPAAWQRAGFALSRAPVPGFLASHGCTAWLDLPTQKQRLAVGLGARGAERIKSGILTWVWSDAPPGTRVGDFATQHISSQEADEAFKSHAESGSSDQDHPNGIINIDQVVLRTLDIDTTLETFESSGVETLRKRDDLYPGVIQAFLRPSEDVIIEVVAATPELRKKHAENAEMLGGMVAFNETSNSIWGLTYVVSDIEAAAALFKPDISKINKAKQPGRKIATLRSEALGLRAAIAIMSAHVKPRPGQDTASAGRAAPRL